MSDKEIFHSHTDVWQGKATQYGGKKTAQTVLNGCEYRFLVEHTYKKSKGSDETLSDAPAFMIASLYHHGRGAPISDPSINACFLQKFQRQLLTSTMDPLYLSPAGKRLHGLFIFCPRRAVGYSGGCRFPGSGPEYPGPPASASGTPAVRRSFQPPPPASGSWPPAWRHRPPLHENL